jgi:hypothetical protein
MKTETPGLRPFLLTMLAIMLLLTTTARRTGVKGGGVSNGSLMTVTNSTIVGNSAVGSGPGGGIFSTGGSANSKVLALINVAIASNAGGNGGGVYLIDNAQTNVKNTIIANNSAERQGRTCLPTLRRSPLKASI